MKRMLTVLVLLFMVSALWAESAQTVAYMEYDPTDSTAAWYGTSGSRGVTGGYDLDGDGKMEVYAVHYGQGGGVVGLEYTGDGAMEVIWHSDTTSTTYSTGTRMVQVADLDGDGLKEVIFFRGYYTDDPNGGLYIYEADGTDNGFKDPVHYTLNGLGQIFNFNGVGAMGATRVEYFLVDDVDGDDTEELLVPFNGPSMVFDYGDTTETDTVAYRHSGDFFAIMSATGDLQGGFGTLVSEYVVSARDVDMGTVGPDDPLFDLDNRLGGGSPNTLTVSDLDGDGNKEMFCHVWNYFNNFVVEATGPDAYTLGDTTNVNVTYPDDHVCLMHPDAADLDGDGKDEVYVSNYYSGHLWKVEDLDGEATTLTMDEFTILNDTTAGADPVSAIFGVAAADANGDGTKEIYVGSSYNTGDLIRWDGSEFTVFKTDTIDASFPEMFIAKMWPADIDGDGKEELITAHQGVPDSIVIETETDTTTIANPHNWIIRVVEVGDVVSVKDLPVITPNDYKLAAAYPNPFNPTTVIEFTLPVNKEISLIVYNELGQEVTRLIDGKTYQKGSYSVTWNGTNALGKEVASGVYFYSLKYGNFTKTRKVTYLK
ncbi:T9SS type A sorting domain-containing protein [Fidelibacter multiformis]|uniref:T9SS type A sorting domain-containing protein n=1 Tax=Fidelibacter multiformis TaxID=3377529 RepID=UPI0037DDD7FF